MTYTLEISRRAKSDLAAIWRYGLSRWGALQAERYAGDIRASLLMLVENPLIGIACDEIRTGSRRSSIGSHMVFYRLIGTRLQIVRILHERMDFGQHF